jgi:formate dehydrogenase maturation protein FdhE
MSILSPGAIKKYVKNGGVHCPHCGSDNLDEFGQDFDETGIYKYIRCLVCDERWTDIYKLVDMIPEED